LILHSFRKLLRVGERLAWTVTDASEKSTWPWHHLLFAFFRRIVDKKIDDNVAKACLKQYRHGGRKLVICTKPKARSPRLFD
jgi:hypothetical protein